jgi:hypothetical protein
VAVAGAVGAIYYDSKVSDNQKKYDQFPDRNHPEILLAYADKRDKAGNIRNISTILAIIAACGFSITFLF